MCPVDLVDDLLLLLIVLLPVGEDLLDEAVEVWVASKGPLRDELLAARGALLVARAEGGDDAVSAESEKKELKYYVEKGKPHPRKQAKLAS